MLALAGVCALLPWLDASFVLFCLPLVLLAWALYRGRAWGAFGLLGLCSMVLLFSGVAPTNEPTVAAALGLAGGLGLACFCLVVPVLWGHDRLATVVAALSVLCLGLGGAVWISVPPESISLELEGRCAGGRAADEVTSDDLAPRSAPAPKAQELSLAARFVTASPVRPGGGPRPAAARWCSPPGRPRRPPTERRPRSRPARGPAAHRAPPGGGAGRGTARR